MPLMIRDKKIEKIASKFHYRPKENIGRFKSKPLKTIREASNNIYDEQAAKYFRFEK